MATGLLPGAALIPQSLLGIAGTRMTFQQTTAPVGWVMDASVTDHFAYINSASPGVIQSGNVSGAGNFLVGNWTSGSHALVLAEIPSHLHSITDLQHGHTGQVGTGGGTGFPVGQPSGTVVGTIGASFSGITSTNNNGGGASHAHPMNNATWNYATFMVAQKS